MTVQTAVANWQRGRRMAHPAVTPRRRLHEPLLWPPQAPRGPGRMAVHAISMMASGDHSSVTPTAVQAG